MAGEDREIKITIRKNKKNFTTNHTNTTNSFFDIHSSFVLVRVGSWLIFLLFFLSCQTTVQTSYAFFENANSLPLESGALLYLFADVKDARPVIDLLPIEELNNRQVKQMLDRTGFLAAALFPPESGKRFQIAAYGNYPKSQVDMALSMDKDWQKSRSQAGGSFWYSQTNRLSLAINSRQAFAASSLNDKPFDPLTTSGVEMPESFTDFRRGSILSCWLENPSPLIRKFINDMGIPLNIPIQKIFVNLLPAQKQYQAVIRLQFQNSSYARSMAAILSFAAGFAPNELAAVLFANPPVQNGNYIDIKTGLLNEEVIVRFFDLFKFF